MESMNGDSQQSSIPTPSSSESIHPEENWDNFFKKLVAYKQKHGHCIIPQSYEEDPDLAQWVFEQRAKGQDKLDKEKVEKLTSISLEWYPPESNDQDKWHSMLNSLLAYKEKYGDCLVPQRYSDDPKLGRWVNKQRENKDRLLPERRKLLDDIDFTWKVVQREPWDNMYQRLIEYKRKHGDCLVPQRYKKDPRLGGWVREQRKRKSLMPADRKRRLDTIDFTWKAKQDKTDLGEASEENDTTGKTANRNATSKPPDAQAATSRNTSNSGNGRLEIGALQGQQYQVAVAAPPSPYMPQSLVNTIGPVVPTVNLLTTIVNPVLHAQSALAQLNGIIASQQGQSEQQATQLALLQRQILQTRGHVLLNGGTPPLLAHLFQQQFNVRSASDPSGGGEVRSISTGGISQSKSTLRATQNSSNTNVGANKAPPPQTT